MIARFSRRSAGGGNRLAVDGGDKIGLPVGDRECHDSGDRVDKDMRRHCNQLGLAVRIEDRIAGTSTFCR